jgi:hypothetical protein
MFLTSEKNGLISHALPGKQKSNQPPKDPCHIPENAIEHVLPPPPDIVKASHPFIHGLE